MLVHDARARRQGHCLQPAQYTEFAARVTPAVEDDEAKAAQDINFRF